MNEIKEQLKQMKFINQQELGRLVDDSDNIDNYYFKVGFCKGQLDLIKLLEQVIQEEESVKH